VADVVPLDHANRILVHQGLLRMRSGRCRPGIAALLRVAGRDGASLGAADLGFAVGPRLNAAGRLADMRRGIECLLSEDPQQALAIAQELDRLNRERRRIEDEMRDDALAWLAGWAPEDGELPFGLCLYQPEWHQGVIGILASRIKDRYHRPVIAFAPGGEGMLKGSARSVPGLHIRDALDAVATRHPGLLMKFGGHAMAAGLSLEAARYPEFCAAFDAEVRRHLEADALCGTFHSDGPLEPPQFTLELAERLRDGGPWGQGFPEPAFDGRFRVEQRKVLKERHLRLTLRPLEGGPALPAIAFAQAEDCDAGEGDLVETGYRLEVNEYNGRRDLQLNIQFIRTLEPT
jgi:single-stranded-DNA-specific exonuclease